MATKRPSRTVRGDSAGGGDEFSQGRAAGTAIISGATFRNRSVVYADIGGIAIVEGDIALGPVDKVQTVSRAAQEGVAAQPMASIAHSVGITGSQFRWPNCTVPYEIDSALPNQTRITDAIAHWEANTGIRFVVRTSEANYVRFSDEGSGNWSQVGMQGGMQTISLSPGAVMGTAVHEIGHAVGLWHEQSREDRDLFVTINWANIQSGMSHNFNQHITDGDDLGAYDYGSIMHYPRTAFSTNGQDTIVPVDASAQIGQRAALSAGDIAGVRAMYPTCHLTVTKGPWREPITRFKKIRDDNRFKKLRDDQITVKSIRDPKGPRDPGPIKVAFDPMPNPTELLTLPELRTPGMLRPFSLATGHHAEAAGEFDESTASYLGVLQQQQLDIEAAIAAANATAAQAMADAARLQEAADTVAASFEEAVNDLGGSA